MSSLHGANATVLTLRIMLIMHHHISSLSIQFILTTSLTIYYQSAILFECRSGSLSGQENLYGRTGNYQ